MGQRVWSVPLAISRDAYRSAVASAIDNAFDAFCALSRQRDIPETELERKQLVMAARRAGIFGPYWSWESIRSGLGGGSG